MIELTAAAREIRDVSRYAAEYLRAQALAVDADPDAMEPYLDSEVFAMIRQYGLPVEYRESLPGTPLRIPDRVSCLENTVGTLELARGDAAVALACPAPALAGTMVSILGDERQRERFFTRVHGGRTWTFFAMTEPDVGSDATALRTRLEKDGTGGWSLTGRKRYVGNAARGGVGVVFARTGRSPLSIRAVLVEPPQPGWYGRRLDMIGLRGAYISELEFDAVPVRDDQLLGAHLSVTRRGMWGAMQTFNAMRVQVAATAVGTALAMVEYVAEHRKGAPGAELVRGRVEAARRLVYEAAARIDQAPERGYLSSAAKVGATRVGVETARWAAGAVGPGGLIEHPLLEKWTRDVRAFEFMEGTENIHRLRLAAGYQAGEADA
jgi:alkylation response protein AidB-like acyl-CoA dehydrogenase